LFSSAWSAGTGRPDVGGPLQLLGLLLTFLPSILNLGIGARANFAETHVMPDVAGDVLYTIGFFVALIMWGFGLVWLVFALASIHMSKPFHFNMGWWGFTFPIGVYSISTITLGVEMPSTFFRVFGTVRIIPLSICIGLTSAPDSQRGRHIVVGCSCCRYCERVIFWTAALCPMCCETQSKRISCPTRQ